MFDYERVYENIVLVEFIEDNSSDYKNLLHQILNENINEKLEYLLSLHRKDIYWFIWNELMDIQTIA